MTFAEDGGGGGGDGKVKRIVVDALAKRESSTADADVTVFEGRAAQVVGVVTGAGADEDNEAVNRNDGGAFVIFDRG